ncbi:MAG TPA: ABC transporter ATP-binding protein [Stellaceae bacterium]|jgi:spermidine/putrescine ABC transporter ATP-binding subunit|nr:ABC transporter ATP-binding protein [Stellaceae bacterium]
MSEGLARVLPAPRLECPVAREATAPVCSVRLRNIAKSYGDHGVVRDLSLDVRAGEFLTLLGPSGSGKTTTLMMIAGFVAPDAGDIFVNDCNVTRDPPYRRDIGMVFQSYALFPHLTVFRNVAFPLEVRKMPRREIAERVAAALRLVKLDGLEGRYPMQLSGGQQQRVALARAIVFRPPLLLMDEPLGALDKKLREHMQVELLNIKRSLDVSVIHVTHDQEEALAISDRIVVMADGMIQQVGAPEELYQRPANRFVADFIGGANILDGRIASVGGGLTTAEADGLLIRIGANSGWTTGHPVALILRPERVRVGDAARGSANRFDGVVEQAVFVGDASRLTIRLDGKAAVTAKVSYTGAVSRYAPGDRVPVGWDADDAWIVAGDAATT